MRRGDVDLLRQSREQAAFEIDRTAQQRAAVAAAHRGAHAGHDERIDKGITDGSDLYVWDREKKEIVAQIGWIDEPTPFGSTMRVRTNHFYDHSLADIARHLCERVEIRHAIVNSVPV